ncbi:hypothetical protein ACFL1R_02740 [Candidatus Latescibacterota bacterium]
MPRLLFLSSLVLMLCIIGSCSVSADSEVLGPSIEIGGGLSGYQMQSRPEWAGHYYFAGVLSGAVRIFGGLSVQAGTEFGAGDNPSVKWIDYGDRMRLKLNKRTYKESLWYGVRYEIPMSLLPVSFYGADIIYASLGMMNAKYGIRSSLWEEDGTVINKDEMYRYHMAKVSGIYGALAARWRFDTDVSQETGAWYGSYGVDAGVKFIRYNDSETKYDTVMEPESGFGCFQIFIIGFMKIKIFD